MVGALYCPNSPFLPPPIPTPTNQPTKPTKPTNQPTNQQDLQSASKSQPRTPHTGPSVADRFRQAYIDRETARREREQRALRIEQRRVAKDTLMRSGGAREVSSWLDAL